MSRPKQAIASGSGKCPVAFALDIFGDKWSLLILRDIFFKKKRYYSEFLDSAEKISTNILASRLAKLEDEGIISRTQDAKKLSKFVYAPTEKGEDLLPTILDMIEWSAKYDPQPVKRGNIIDGAPRNLLKRSRNDRVALIDDILIGMRNSGE